MTLIADKDKEEQRKIENKLDTEAARLGIDYYDGDGSTRFDFDDYGLCTSCKYFRAIQTMYGREVAKCNSIDIRLNTVDPIKKCTWYVKVGEMTLVEMQSMAILLDFKKNEIGFIK